MDTNKLQDILGNAQKLMLNEDFNRKVEGHAASMGSGAQNVNISEFERQAFGYDDSQTPVQQPQQPVFKPSTQGVPKNSKLPKAILESFAKTPAMTGEENDMTPLGQITRNLKVNEQTDNLRKSYMSVSQPTYQSVPSAGVDYSIIRAIINECLNEKLGEIKKNLLNESSGEGQIRGLKVGEGNKIQFLDMKGNVYEGILKLKKKA